MVGAVTIEFDVSEEVAVELEVDPKLKLGLLFADAPNVNRPEDGAEVVAGALLKTGAIEVMDFGKVRAFGAALLLLPEEKFMLGAGTLKADEAG